MAGFLQRFQQGIGRSFRHRLSSLNHNHPALRLHRLPGKTASDVADLLQAQLGRSAAAEPRLLGFGAGQQTALMLIGGFHPEQVGVIAFQQASAFPGRGLTIGQQSLQKTHRRQLTSHPFRAGKEIGRGHTALGQGRRKQINGEGLADQIPKQRAQARCS